MLAGKNIVDAVNLLLYGKGFTPDTVADDDILVYDAGTGLWTLQSLSVYVHPNHSGEVTSVGDGAQTITAAAVTNAKLANMAQNQIKGRVSAGAGDPEDLTATQTRTLLNVEDNSAADQVASEVPFTPAGDIAATDVQAAVEELDTEKAKVALETNTLYGEVFNTPDTPADNDVLIYDLSEGEWRLQTNLLNPISGIAFLTEGYDLEIDGDIVLPTGGTVDGIDLDVDVLTKDGGGLDGEPLANSMLYWKIPPASPGFWDHGHSGLLNGMNTPLHYHNTDRDRDNHTGTQAASTISDFEDTVGDMFDSSGNEHEMVDVEYGSDEKVNLSVNVPRLYGVIPSDTATNSTTWVDIPLNSITKSALTHTNGNANVEFDEPGDYMIAYAVVSDFNVNNQLAYGRIELDTGGGYALLAQSARQTHTSTALGTLVSSTVGPYSFSAGDEIKLTAAFSSADAGSNFLRNKCSLSIWRIS